jgi:hypothetical protein
MRKTFSAIVFIATLAAPIVAPANALAGGRVSLTVRVYDPYRRDYHYWDRVEERRYRAYLAERHRAYVRYERQRLAERREYWRWRHHEHEEWEHRR